MYDWRIVIADIKNLIIDIKNFSIKIYLHLLRMNATFNKLDRWCTFLVPLYLNQTWQHVNNTKIQPFLKTKIGQYFVKGFLKVWLILETIFFMVVEAFVFIANFISTNIITTILRYKCFQWLHYLSFIYSESRASSSITNTRLFFNIFIYSFGFLFNFYVLVTAWDAWQYLNNDSCFWNDYAHSTDIPYKRIHALWQILYADITPYSVFEDENRYRLGRLFNLIDYQGPLPMLLDLPLQQYAIVQTLQYCVSYMLMLIFITLLHVLWRIKHIFDDYLRDIDPEMSTFLYYSFCFISLFFFFANELQLTEYIINLFSTENLMLFFGLYNFFFCMYGILTIYTILSANTHKQLLILYFMYYLFIIVIIFIGVVSYIPEIHDQLLNAYLDYKAAVSHGRKGTTFQHLIFYENTPTMSNKYLTYLVAKERSLELNHPQYMEKFKK